MTKETKNNDKSLDEQQAASDVLFQMAEQEMANGMSPEEAMRLASERMAKWLAGEPIE